jgi:hypothetical protein
VVRVAITQAAFEAITGTLPLGSVGYENQINERGTNLAGPRRRRPSEGDARAGRELQRRRPAAGGGRRAELARA